MCGIAGYFFTSDPSPSAIALSAAKTTLAHRGPDDSGLFEDRAQGVGLVHTRLSILNLSPLGHQPMTSDEGRVVLVFNGAIYNFCEMRAELEAQGYSFRGHSDTEVLLNLYLTQRQSKVEAALDALGYISQIQERSYRHCEKIKLLFYKKKSFF